MKNLFRLSTFLFATTLATGCASKSKINSAGLDKYPLCYHTNPKLSNACIQKNEAGESVTALQLENAAYPGQYK